MSDIVVRELSELLFRIGVVRFGSFTLKDGRLSPVYFDLRILVSYPDALARVARAMTQRAEAIAYDRLAGLPYAGLPIAVAMSLIGGRPLIYPRKETKSYGTKRAIEGEFAAGERALVIDDVITSGGAKVEAIEVLRGAGLEVSDVLVLVDRRQPGTDVLAEVGVELHSVLPVMDLLTALRDSDAIEEAEYRSAQEFLGGSAEA
jgi:uridine monophosphate synthetase